MMSDVNNDDTIINKISKHNNDSVNKDVKYYPFVSLY